MVSTGGLPSRMMHRLGTAATVLAIAAASVVGLHDWADDAATHGAATKAPSGQNLPA